MTPFTGTSEAVLVIYTRPETCLRASPNSCASLYFALAIEELRYGHTVVAFFAALTIAAFLLAVVSALQLWGGRPTARFKFVELPATGPELVVLGCEVVNPLPMRASRAVGVTRAVGERVDIIFSVYVYGSDEMLTGEPVVAVLTRPSLTGGEKERSPTRLIVNEPAVFIVVAKKRGADNAQILIPGAPSIDIARGMYRVEVGAHFRSLNVTRTAGRVLTVGTSDMAWGEERDVRSLGSSKLTRRMFVTPRRARAPEAEEKEQAVTEPPG